MTTICEATHIELGPVQFSETVDSTGRRYVYATQRLRAIAHDGNHFELSVHLAHGCTSLAAGPDVTIPPASPRRPA
jgi:hypothetical protein